jgi:hypothetical protein
MPEELRLTKLYCATREDADETATLLTAQGLGAEVGRQVGGTGWAVTVTGAPDALDALEEQVRAQLRQDSG